jgi:hypothetical protein
MYAVLLNNGIQFVRRLVKNFQAEALFLFGRRLLVLLFNGFPPTASLPFICTGVAVTLGGSKALRTRWEQDETSAVLPYKLIAHYP